MNALRILGKSETFLFGYRMIAFDLVWVVEHATIWSMLSHASVLIESFDHSVIPPVHHRLPKARQF